MTQKQYGPPMSLNTPGYPYLELCYCENLTNKLETNVHLHTGQTAPVGLQGMHTTIVNQGPVVQSVISLTNSLRVISLTVLADSIYNILIFFAEKI